MARRRELPRDRGVRSARLLLFVAVVILLAQLAGLIGGIARWLDVYAMGSLALVWLMPAAWAAVGVGSLGLAAGALGLDGMVTALLALGLVGLLAWRIGRWLDLEFVPLQPLAALCVLLAAEFLMRLTTYFYYGRAAATPFLAILLSALLTPAAWHLGRFFLLSPRR